MDPLADVLAVAGVHGTLGARIEAGERWAWWATGIHGAAFHAITSGTAWLAPRGQAPRQLMPGDVVLLPRGSEHVLGSDEATVASTGPHNSSGYEQASSTVVRIGTGPARTHILCAHYEYDPAISTQVFSLLPDLVHIRAQHGGDGLDDTIRLLGRELVQRQVATTVVLDSLVDILLVQVLRAWLQAAPHERPEPSWLGALRDPVVGAAVSLLHAEPAREWTNAALAHELAVSPATLSRRCARADAGRLPDPLADGPCRAAPARQRRQPRVRRPLGRLHVGLRLQPRVQPRPLAPAGALQDAGAGWKPGTRAMRRCSCASSETPWKSLRGV
jgi:hypothetical protein